MLACMPNLAGDADCLELMQRLATRPFKGFRRLPYKGTTMSAGSALLKQASPPCFLDLDHSLFFIPPVWPGYYKVILSKFCRVVVGVLLNMSRTILEQDHYCYFNHPFRQFIQTPALVGLGGFISSPAVSHTSIPPPQFAQTSFALTPLMVSPLLIHRHT